MADCIQTKRGTCTPVVDGAEMSHPCDEGVCWSTPGAPEYVLTIRNPDNGVITSSSEGVVTVIEAEG